MKRIKNYNFTEDLDTPNLICFTIEEIKFGLQTNGNIDAILMSLPPSTGW